MDQQKESSKVEGVGGGVSMGVSEGQDISPNQKYRPYLSVFNVDLPDRTWPNNKITKAPVWCSVDLRDGNQALINPMNLDRKLEMWDLLLKIGFKEIEVGFPSASAVEFEFTRHLIDNNLIPEGVALQVLTQARSHLIDRTFEAIEGAKKAVVHMYNSTSELQRRVVFRKDRSQIIDLAVKGVAQIKELAEKAASEVIFEYSPESFTGTELDFALEICEAVMEVWQPTPQDKMILNLPSTVEMAMPNVHADQIEWFCRNVKNRESVLISLHPHNDRGTGVASAELALLAGGDRVEGTLFGNGERTGNVDIVTLALNMYSQGIDPGLNFSDIANVRSVSERCTQLKVHERHPYSGELVFTAFSGSHQDAIRKGMLAHGAADSTLWEVPYLPVDPDDIGRKYEPIIRINSQSGKGGVAFIMETEYGFALPKSMHPEFSTVIQEISDKSGVEVSGHQIWKAFSENYLENNIPYKFLKFKTRPISGVESDDENGRVTGVLKVEINGEEQELTGDGNGPIDACKAALVSGGCESFRLTDYVQHALSTGSDAEAAAYIQIETGKGKRYFGVGRDPNTQKASIRALLCAVNRAFS